MVIYCVRGGTEHTTGGNFPGSGKSCGNGTGVMAGRVKPVPRTAAGAGHHPRRGWHGFAYGWPLPSRGTAWCPHGVSDLAPGATCCTGTCWARPCRRSAAARLITWPAFRAGLNPMEPAWTPTVPQPPAGPRGRWRRSPAFAGMGTDGIFLPHRGSRGYCLAGRCRRARDIACWRACDIAGPSVTAGALFTGVAGSVLLADLAYQDTCDLPGSAVEGEEPAMLRAAARWLKSPGWIAARAGCRRWAGRPRHRNARGLGGGARRRRATRRSC